MLPTFAQQRCVVVIDHLWTSIDDFYSSTSDMTLKILKMSIWWCQGGCRCAATSTTIVQWSLLLLLLVLQDHSIPSCSVQWIMTTCHRYSPDWSRVPQAGKTLAASGRGMFVVFGRSKYCNACTRCCRNSFAVYATVCGSVKQLFGGCYCW